MGVDIMLPLTGTYQRMQSVTNLSVITTTHPLKAPSGFPHIEGQPLIVSTAPVNRAD